MKPEQRGHVRPATGSGDDRQGAVSVAGDSHGECVSATDLLVDLGQCQRSIRSLLRAAIAGLVPVSNQTLPAVSFTLGGLIHATEMAANKVLDHAEGLAADRERLGKALARLEPLLDTSSPTGRQAWLDVTESTKMLSGRVMCIMSAMAFQDLTSQQLVGAIETVEQVRGQLIETLKLLDLPVESAPTGESSVIEGPRPAFPVQSRQAVADRLWAELKG
jgi:chemotaxis regulatin CheY-phosphate phosphatase CheZ